MSEQKEFQTLVDNIGRHVVEKYVKPLLQNQVSFFRAEVVAAAANSAVTVRRPFDNVTLSLPYVSSAASLAAGDQCVVLVLGSMSNAIVLGDGMLSNL